MVMKGKSACASFAEISCISTPKERAVVIARSYSRRRSRLDATRMPPVRYQPVACPVSASSEA